MALMLALKFPRCLILDKLLNGSVSYSQHLKMIIVTITFSCHSVPIRIK